MNEHIILKDGRKLSYALYGDAGGTPVMYFHGAPSCALEPLLVGDEAFRRHQLRVIAVNRPGTAGSDPKPALHYSGFTADIIELADQLGLQRFALAGLSAGAGYVVACTVQVPERITAAVLVSAAWQMYLPSAREHLKQPYKSFWALSRNAPALEPVILKSLKGSIHLAGYSVINSSRHLMAIPDQQVLMEPARAEVFLEAVDLACSPATGAARDLALAAGRFEFPPEQVRFPITWLHGEEDIQVPVEHARYLAQKMPACRLLTFPGEAHFSTAINQFETVVSYLQPQLNPA